MIDVAALKASVNLRHVMEADLGPPKKDGRQPAWLCPFHHERTPSLKIHPDGMSWKCFGCDKSGDVIAWMRERRGLSFKEACDALGAGTFAGTGLGSKPVAAPPTRPREPMRREAVGLPPETLGFVDDCAKRLWAPEGDRARAYLLDRGLSETTIRAAKLGFNADECRLPENRYVARGITIPWLHQGKIHALNVRRANQEPKYLLVKGSRRGVPFPASPTSGRVVVMCEGEFDALLLRQEAGDIVDAITVGSASDRASPEIVRCLLGAPSILVCTDCDEAGERAVRYWQSMSTRVRRIRTLEGLDVTDTFLSGGNLRLWILEILTEPEARANVSVDKRPSSR